MSLNAVQCKVCSRHCNIQEGKVGFCGVRENIGGKLQQLNYGRVVSTAIDPIEKKPLYHFYPGSETLSIAGLGCNFRCSFCQNWDIAQFPILKAKEIGRTKTNELIKELGYEYTPNQIVEYACAKKVRSIAYTYNEPAISLDYYIKVMQCAHDAGLCNVWVTNGYISSESFGLVERYLDAVNIDLKAFTERFYRKHCKSELEVVKENIRKFHKAGILTEVTTLLIPGENDSEKEIEKLCAFIVTVSKEIPLHFARFFPAFRMLDKPITPLLKLQEAYEIATSIGIEYVYIGNVIGGSHSDTKCPNCGKILIKRRGLVNKTNVLDVVNSQGLCKNCSNIISGKY